MVHVSRQNSLAVLRTPASFFKKKIYQGPRCPAVDARAGTPVFSLFCQTITRLPGLTRTRSRRRTKKGFGDGQHHTNAKSGPSLSRSGSTTALRDQIMQDC